MNLKKPMDLYCWWNTGDQVKLQDLGIKLASDEPRKKMLTLYSVDYIYAGNIEYENRPCGVIKSGGEEFTTVMTYSELKKYISDYL